MLHQGAQLKNTREVYGVCVYAGSQTKIHLNSKITHNKFSTVERSLNRYLLAFVLILIIELAVSTVLTLTYGIEYVNSTPYSNTINGILNRPAGKIPQSHEYLCFCGRDLNNTYLVIPGWTLNPAALSTTTTTTTPKPPTGNGTAEINEDHWYLGSTKFASASEGLVTVLLWMVLYNYIIPISLYVSLELQKFIGSMFVQWDNNLKVSH